jgi:hypothetical protein
MSAMSTGKAKYTGPIGQEQRTHSVALTGHVDFYSRSEHSGARQINLSQPAPRRDTPGLVTRPQWADGYDQRWRPSAAAAGGPPWGHRMLSRPGLRGFALQATIARSAGFRGGVSEAASLDQNSLVSNHFPGPPSVHARRVARWP